MRYNELSQDEKQIIEIYQNAKRNHGEIRYEDALMKISKILFWMTYKPKLSFKKLQQYIIKEFEDAAKILPEDSRINKSIKYYKELYGNSVV